MAYIYLFNALSGEFDLVNDSSGGTLAQTLVLGNVTGGTNIIVTVGDKITTDTIEETGVGSGITFNSDLNINSKDIISINSFTLNAIAAPVHSEGLLFYDTATKSLSMYNDEADIALQIGQESYVRVRNETGSTIGNAQVVYISGTNGAPLITKAQSNSLATSIVCGVTTHSIEDNTYGYLTSSGVVHEVNTSSFLAGDMLYLSSFSAGGVTKTKPTGSNYVVPIGQVGVVDGSEGTVIVKIGRPLDVVDVVGAMGDLVDDTTPQLGGDLDLNGKNIDFPTTADISDCLDEDDMASDSDTKICTQQSIKAYTNNNFTMRSEWLQNGIVDKADSTLAFNDGSRVFTINRTGASFDYYIQGVKYTVTTDNVVGTNTVTLTDSEGLWVIYYDGAVLSSILNPSHSQYEDVIMTKCIVGVVYYDAINNKGILYEERHGFTMSPWTHRYLHGTIGMAYTGGLGLGDFNIGSGNNNIDAQFSIASGECYDEDLEIETNTINSTTGTNIFYLDGTDWRWTTQTNFKCMTFDGTDTTRLAYNNSGVLTEVTNTRFVLLHVFATNAYDGNPITIIGQAQYLSRSSARDGAETEISNLVLGTLPSKEMKPIASIIYQTRDSYNNDVNARIIQTASGENYVDWRTTPLSAGVSAGDHGSLGGLADDDHPLYSSYELTFDDDDLSSGGVLSVTHDLARKYVQVTIYNNNDKIISPDEVEAIDINNINIDLSSYTPITGSGEEWNLVIR